MVDSQQLQSLSLTARLAIALHCFERYCKTCELNDPEIDHFLDDLWELPTMTPEKWDAWEANHPALVQAALGVGAPLPERLGRVLNSKDHDPQFFQQLIENVAEIVFGSFYGAAEDKDSMKYLNHVVDAVARSGVGIPPLHNFTKSRFVDRHGWGDPLSDRERNDWRAVKW